MNRPHLMDWRIPRLWCAAGSRPALRSCSRSPAWSALTLLSVLLCAPLPASGQIGGDLQPAADSLESFVHESWTVADGLPVNSINSILQSRDGYIWIATFDGLVRFDGVRFTVFNTSNSPDLPSNRIVVLFEARDGSLWMQLEQSKQLVRFHRGVFTHFGTERGLDHGVWILHEDAGGALWLGTEAGIGVIRGERFIPVAEEEITAPVRAMVTRKDGSIWVGTEGAGLFRIEGERVNPVERQGELLSEEIISLHEDRTGTLWVGTAQGVWRFGDAPQRVLSEETLGFRESPRTGETWVLTAGRVYRMGSQGPVAVVEPAQDLHRPQRLLADPAGGMLYASGTELHREGRRIYSLATDGDWGQETRQVITTLVFDHEGSLWLGTHAAGLHRLKPAPFTVYSKAEGLSHPNVYTVYEDRSGVVWIGTMGGGTNRLERGRVGHLTSDAGSPDIVLSFLQDRAGRLWIGGWGPGVRVCVPPFRRCAPPPGSGVGDQAVRAIHEDSEGLLWFGTTGGVFQYDGVDWTRIGKGDDPIALPVRVFRETRDGALWMGTNGSGLVRVVGGRFTYITTADGLPIDIIRSLHEDEDGWLWVGTEGRGLARLAPADWAEGRAGRIVSYRARDGLFDEVIHQILEDDYGRLWMSSNRGIFWVDRAELLAFAEGRIPRISSTGYTERDGLRNREANGGSQPAGIRSRDGRLWFATQDGVAVVDPSHIQHNSVPPPVVIEQVSAGGVALWRGEGELEVGPDQRDLEIEYTALSFLAPANVRFRYRLEPYDREWVEAGARRTAFYTKVPPGRYTFRVIASNNDGIWNEAGASIALRVTPHFHETRTATVLLVLVLFLLGGGGVGWRLRSHRIRERELTSIVEARTAALRQNERQLEAKNAQLGELHEARSRLFANLSHEFRTPLTLILGPLRSLLEGRHGTMPPSAKEQHEMMLRNSERLLGLINQILDLSKLQSGAVSLDRRLHDLVGNARAATQAFAPLAERRGIALGFHSELPEIAVAFDAEQLEKVILNLVSNALKFTGPGGSVVVSVGAGADAAEIAVRDTGVGIAPEKLPHIFDRFYQADASATRRYEGTGIGLALAKELVELHGGTIHAESTPGVGSTFTVRLPVSDLFAPSGSNGDPHATAGQTPVPALSLDGPVESDPAPASREDPEEDRTTILVVDDHPDVRRYIRSILPTSFRIIEAADGRAGLERARAALPDLIVADVMMPELDGLGLARALKNDPMTDAIPVVLLTARAAPEDQIAGLQTGADAYLVKPFDPGVLDATVAGLLAQRRRLRERFRQGVAAPPPSTPAAPAALDGRLRPLVEARLTHTDFGPEALAAAASLSYHQLYRALRDELDTTPSRYIRTVRAECAAELLRQGAGSVTEIAYSVGFESLSYFRRAFRERFGTSPSEHLAVGPPATRPR